MSGSIFRRDDCRLCGGHNLELVLQLTPTPVGDAYVSVQRLDHPQETYPLDLALCRSCGELQLLDVIDPEILYPQFIYTTSISLGLVEHFRRYADDVLHRVDPPTGALVVDIGSNDGTLLRFFQKRGMRVLGVDPARDIARKATESGIETLPAFFTAELGREIKHKHGPAAIVTSNYTFANIDNVAEFVEGIRVLLAPDGVFIFETGYAVDIVREGLFDNIYHEHLSYFSVRPLDDFFRCHGMALIDVEQNTVKGGSIRSTVQLSKGPRAVLPSITTLKALETEVGIDRAEPFDSLATKMAERKDQLSSLLCELTAQEKTVAGYGASVGATTLLYQFGLGNRLSFIVDDNPAKQKLFSPGYQIPVLPPAAIYQRKPDYVVILAWRYSEPIVKKHQAYLDHGGHFIVPWPEVVVS